MKTYKQYGMFISNIRSIACALWPLLVYVLEEIMYMLWYLRIHLRALDTVSTLNNPHVMICPYILYSDKSVSRLILCWFLTDYVFVL